MRIRAFLFIYSIHISRFYFADITQFDSFQLHGFSDASEDAYAAVVYIHSQDRDGSIGISLVIAKSRVSPIKRLSIPHLEPIFCLTCCIILRIFSTYLFLTYMPGLIVP